jgi:hypothetical protein
MSGLAGIVSGWPAVCAVAEESAALSEHECHDLARELIRQGILSDDHALGKSALPLDIPKPSASLLSEGDDERRRTNARAIMAMLMALTSATLRIRHGSLERMTRWASRTNQDLKAEARPLEISRLRELVHTYTRLRPIFFAARDACLFESLVMLSFLSHYGIHADWVFGVRLRPWLAHCWLQRDGVVLSDTLDHVNMFTPIMVV